MTRRRFIADQWTSATAALTGDQAAHLARVLRAAPGQSYDLAVEGSVYRGEITMVSPERVEFALHEELAAEAALPVHLVLAVFKFDHLEWAIEKATELGVQRITPVFARRTEKHLQQAAGKRAERWRRIVLEASKQSRRTAIPEVADPVGLRQALADEQSSTRILLSEADRSTPLRVALEQVEGEVVLAVGPEGGWAAEEMQMFEDYGWRPVTLGPRILRAETAAIAAIAIASAQLG